MFPLQVIAFYTLATKSSVHCISVIVISEFSEF